MTNHLEMKEDFTKEDFFNLMDRLHEYAFNANFYLYAIEQLKKDEYVNVQLKFPCSYLCIQNALIEALLLNLMRIYDRYSKEDKWNLGILLKMAKDISNPKHTYNELFKNYTIQIFKDNLTQTKTFNIVYTYDYEDIRQLPDIRNDTKSTEEDLLFMQFLTKQNPKWNVEHIKLTTTELIDSLFALVNANNKKINKLNEQRNKLLAHNLKEYLDKNKRTQFRNKNNLIYEELKELTIISLQTIIYIDSLLNRDNAESLMPYKIIHYGNRNDIIKMLELLSDADCPIMTITALKPIKNDA